MTAQNTKAHVWNVVSTDGQMTGPMIGMLLCIVLLFGAYLPSFTGNWVTLAVPFGAALGLVVLFRLPKPQISFNSGFLVFSRGGKTMKKFDLATLRFGYARLNFSQAQMGVSGTVLVLQDGEQSLTIGAHKFLFDDSRLYNVKDAEYYDIGISRESDFREVIGQFNERLAVHRPQAEATQGQERSRNVESAPALIFELQLFHRRGWNKEKPPEDPLVISLENNNMCLRMRGDLLSSTSAEQLQWSAGKTVIGSGSGWTMAILILQFPNYGPVAIGAMGMMGRKPWTFDVKYLNRPQFSLGIAQWLQLTRMIGIDQYLKQQ